MKRDAEISEGCVFDGWSLAIFVRELAFYRVYCLGRK